MSYSHGFGQMMCLFNMMLLGFATTEGELGAWMVHPLSQPEAVENIICYAVKKVTRA